jgi:hypothetical protein
MGINYFLIDFLCNYQVWYRSFAFAFVFVFVFVFVFFGQPAMKRVFEMWLSSSLFRPEIIKPFFDLTGSAFPGAPLPLPPSAAATAISTSSSAPAPSTASDSRYPMEAALASNYSSLAADVVVEPTPYESRLLEELKSLPSNEQAMRLRQLEPAEQTRLLKLLLQLQHRNNKQVQQHPPPHSVSMSPAVAAAPYLMQQHQPPMLATAPIASMVHYPSPHAAHHHHPLHPPPLHHQLPPPPPPMHLHPSHSHPPPHHLYPDDFHSTTPTPSFESNLIASLGGHPLSPSPSLQPNQTTRESFAFDYGDDEDVRQTREDPLTSGKRYTVDFVKSPNGWLVQSRTVFVYGLAAGVEEDDVQHTFMDFGDVEEVKVCFTNTLDP